MRRSLCLLLSATAACATLPRTVAVADAEIFSRDPETHAKALECAAHLNQLRSSAARSRSSKTILTLLFGATTVAGASVAVARSSSFPPDAKGGAIVALVGGILTMFAAVLPDSTAALTRHATASTSWDAASYQTTSNVQLRASTSELLERCVRDEPTAAVPPPPGSEAKQR